MKNIIDTAQENVKKIFAHGVCVALVTDDTAAVFFKDGSRTLIRNEHGHILISRGRPAAVDLTGKVIEDNATAATLFARRLCALEGKQATPEDEEIFSYCERILLNPVPLDRKKGTKDHERKAADDHNKEVRKSNRTEASATIRKRERRHVRG